MKHRAPQIDLALPGEQFALVGELILPAEFVPLVEAYPVEIRQRCLGFDVAENTREVLATNERKGFEE